MPSPQANRLDFLFEFAARTSMTYSRSCFPAYLWLPSFIRFAFVH